MCLLRPSEAEPHPDPTLQRMGVLQYAPLKLSPTPIPTLQRAGVLQQQFTVNMVTNRLVISVSN